MSNDQKQEIINFLYWLESDKDTFLCQHNTHSGANYQIQNYQIEKLLKEYSERNG